MNPPGVRPGTRTTTSSCALLVLLLVSACNLRNPGVDPPAGTLAYPVALTFADPEAEQHDLLYVANSNFDLAYNGGSVQVYDLREVERQIRARGCLRFGVPADGLAPLPEGGVSQMDAGMTMDAGMSMMDAGGFDADAGDADDASVGMALGETPALPPEYDRASQYGTLRGVLCDGRDMEGTECCFDDSEAFLLGGSAKGSEVLIDSYASGIAIAPDGKRLYVPVRSRDRLLYLDVAPDGQISCGGDSGRCSRGASPADADEDPAGSFAPQPNALVVGSIDSLVEGADKATYIATAHETGEVGLFIDDGRGPVLHSSVLSPDFRLTAVTPDLQNRLLYVTTSSSARVSRFGVRDLGDRYALLPSASLFVDQVAGTNDIRDAQVDALDPTRLYVLMRGLVRSVLFLRLDSTLASGVRLEGEARVGLGPSKLTQAVIGGKRFLLVSCFDERALFVVDEASRELVSVVHGLSGPFEMLVDRARGFLYVADFTANVLRVVDVAGLGDARLPPPRIVATIGKVDIRKGLK